MIPARRSPELILTFTIHYFCSMRVAIIGNPNTGKTTLFNALTGLRQRVGNYPGVTVAKKSGRLTLHDGTAVEIIDLPGIYSLGAQSLDERVALDVLCNHVADTPPPDALLVVCDVTNLLRNLFLPSQLAELGIPMVIALNHADEARKRGMRVDANLLSQRLGGVPVVLCSAAHAEGIADVRAALQSLRTNPVKPSRVTWDPAVLTAIAGVRDAIERDTRKCLPAAEVQRVLFDANSPVLERLAWPQEKRDPVLHEARETIRRAGSNPFAVEALRHYDRLRVVLTGVVTEGDKSATLTHKIDAVLLHRFWGAVIFIAASFLVFMAIFRLASFPMDWISAGVEWASGAVGGLAWLADKPMLNSLLTTGVVGGVGAFLVFLPQILILFFFISLLEDTGYMARAAFLMDKLFSWCGLNGKSFVPLLSGYACAVPSIMGTRTIEDPKARAATAFVVPFMSCSARFPVYALMIGAFVAPRYGALVGSFVMVGMHMLGVAVAVPTAFIATRFVLKVRPQPFVLEMPRYQRPKLRDTFWRMFVSAREFVQRAGTIIFAISVIIWALTWFPHDANVETREKAVYAAELAAEKSVSAEEAVKLIEAEPVEPAPGAADAPPPPSAIFGKRLAGAHMENSYLGRFGKSVQPLFDPAGFDWKITVGVLASFPAREVIVSTLGITYSLGEGLDEESGDLRDVMAKSVWQDGPRKGTPIFTIPVALALMAFFALCSQCGATLATLARELGTRWAVASFLYMTVLAWLSAVAIYQIGSRL
jgi:ferrous iron transport protein B